MSVLKGIMTGILHIYRCYLMEDFHDFNELWSSNMGDSELVSAIENLEIYSPIVEDISMDDNTLCEAVEQIEQE